LIISAKNPKIQWVRALQGRARTRREEGAFVVEGVRLVEEALAAGWETRLLLHTPDLSERGQKLVAEFQQRSVPVEMVSAEVMNAASDTQTPQGVLAVLEIRPLPLPPGLDFAFVPDGVRDPGNLGTMLRTAAAAGAGAVLLPPETVDPFSPKVVRAAMGAHFRLPIHTLDWKDIEKLGGQYGLEFYLAAARAGLPYFHANLRKPIAIVIGGEAEGLGEQAEHLKQDYIHIPMPGEVESLNAAAAAAVLLFEVVRQRQAV
jgi:TrmH family RNA methyltransferase